VVARASAACDPGTGGMNALGVALILLAVLGGTVLVAGLLYADYQNECDHRRWLARRQRWAAREQDREHD